MKLPRQSLTLRAIAIALCGAALAACGGGSVPQELELAKTSAMDGTRLLTTSSAQTATPVATTVTTSSAALPVDPDAITNLRFENTNAQVAQSNIPVTFGQVFAPGHLPAGMQLTGHLDNGVTVPLQLDVKAKHPDGSVRHAIISAVLPALGPGEGRTIPLGQSASGAAGTTVTSMDLLANPLSGSMRGTLDGVLYKVHPDYLIKLGKATTWLSGPIVNEWHVSAPLTTSTGIAHPHLSARFAVRWYNTVKKARVDVTVENNWAYEPAPQNFTYDAQVMLSGQIVYSKPALTHLHHARWRKLFWWNGAAPEVNVKHNTAYLIGTRALPNFDQTLTIPESVLNEFKTKWTGAITEPMSVGMAAPYMPQTGGRGDIGLLPRWAAAYLLSMDQRARDVTLGTADLAGSWSSHYRDKNTGQPVSLIDYPYMTIVGRSTDTKNPVTKQFEAFPPCATSTACATTNVHDVSHQPEFAYLPYLVTGDHYYLEELQFWAMFNVFRDNPSYRENIRGLLKPEQVRGQAWGLRTLAQAAYITPDADRLKAHFDAILANNLDWYNENYSNNAQANKLGAIVNGYALGYSNGRGLAPWMDDFFTSAVGHTLELGFTKAAPLMSYKATFPIERMIGAGACYIEGAMYSMIVRDSTTSPFYDNIGQAFQASLSPTFLALPCGGVEMAAALKLKVGEMTGYSAVTTGYPSNMQPALAYSADFGGPRGASAWSTFMARSVKPDYRTAPQFAIVPR